MTALAKTGIPAIINERHAEVNQIPNCISLNGFVAGDAVQIVSGTPSPGYTCIVEKATTRIDGWAPKDCPAGEASAIMRPGIRLRYGSGVVPATQYFLDPAVAGGLNTVGVIGSLATPSVAPVPTEGGTGTLGAGDYSVTYRDKNANGYTLPYSPAAVATLGASKLLHIGALALPTGGISRDWFMSRAAGSTDLAFIVNRTDGAAFDINSLPLAGAEEPNSVATFPSTGVIAAIGLANGVIQTVVR